MRESYLNLSKFHHHFLFFVFFASLLVTCMILNTSPYFLDKILTNIPDSPGKQNTNFRDICGRNDKKQIPQQHFFALSLARDSLVGWADMYMSIWFEFVCGNRWVRPKSNKFHQYFSFEERQIQACMYVYLFMFMSMDAVSLRWSWMKNFIFLRHLLPIKAINFAFLCELQQQWMNE